jgi:hypothetical protein
MFDMSTLFYIFFSDVLDFRDTKKVEHGPIRQWLLLNLLLPWKIVLLYVHFYFNVLTGACHTVVQYPAKKRSVVPATLGMTAILVCILRQSKGGYLPYFCKRRFLYLALKIDAILCALL